MPKSKHRKKQKSKSAHRTKENNELVKKQQNKIKDLMKQLEQEQNISLSEQLTMDMKDLPK